jgi:hypothetical protein
MSPESSAQLNKLPSMAMAALFAVIFLVMLVLNNYEILWIDDYCRTATGSISEIFSQTWHEYFIWTGRFFVTLATRLFLMSQPPDRLSVHLFDICNSLVFCAYIYAILLFTGSRRSFEYKDLPLLGLILALTICSTDAPSLTIFWKTGAINYLWSATGEIFVLVAFIRYYEGVPLPSNSSVLFYGFPLFCFVVGNCSENIALAVSLILVMFLLAFWNKTRRIPPMILLAATIAHCLGCLILILAPGNFSRMNGSTRVPKSYAHRLTGDLSHLASTLGLHGWLVVAIICIFVYRQGSKKIDQALRLRLLVAVAGVALTFLAMTAAPAGYEGRTAFATESFMICALACLFARRKASLLFDRGVCALCAVLVVVPLSLKLNESVQISEQRDARETLIAEARLKGQSQVVLAPYFIEGVGYDQSRVKRWNMVRAGDIDSDWSNQCFAKAYGIKSSTRGEIPN